jgi:hypothetical protein
LDVILRAPFVYLVVNKRPTKSNPAQLSIPSSMVEMAGNCEQEIHKTRQLSEHGKSHASSLDLDYRDIRPFGGKLGRKPSPLHFPVFLQS